jgi:hypothetical protein
MASPADAFLMKGASGATDEALGVNNKRSDFGFVVVGNA